MISKIIEGFGNRGMFQMAVDTQDSHNCEHCGQLEIGSVVFTEGLGTAWCLDCVTDDSAEWGIPTSTIDELLETERNNKIWLHAQRIQELLK